MGCWSQREEYAIHEGTAGWTTKLLSNDALANDNALQADGSSQADGSHFEVLWNGKSQGIVNWDLVGLHNVDNAIVAIAAARHAGVPAKHAIDALAQFKNVKRRMEVRGEINGITVYDDFAHHPTAIATTINGLRRKVGAQQRIIAVLEPRSNTMKMQVHNSTLPGSLAQADKVFLYLADDYAAKFADTLELLGNKGHGYNDMEKMIQAILADVKPSDHLLIMSNGGFGGIHQKLLDKLSGL